MVQKINKDRPCNSHRLQARRRLLLPLELDHDERRVGVVVDDLPLGLPVIDVDDTTDAVRIAHVLPPH